MHASTTSVRPAKAVQKISLTSLNEQDIAELIEGAIHAHVKFAALKLPPEQAPNEAALRTDYVAKLCNDAGIAPKAFDPLSIFEFLQEIHQGDINFSAKFGKRLQTIQEIKNPETQDRNLQKFKNDTAEFTKQQFSEAQRRAAARREAPLETRIAAVNVMRASLREWHEQDFISAPGEGFKDYIDTALKQGGGIHIADRNESGLFGEQSTLIPGSDVDSLGTRIMHTSTLAGTASDKTDLEFAELLQLGRITSAQGKKGDAQVFAVNDGLRIFAKQDQRDGGDEALRRRRFGQRERAFASLKEPALLIGVSVDKPWNIKDIQEIAGFAMASLAFVDPDAENLSVSELREKAKLNFVDHYRVALDTVTSFDMAVMAVERLANRGSSGGVNINDPDRELEAKIAATIKEVRAMPSDDERLAYLNKRREEFKVQERQRNDAESKIGTTR